MRFLGFLIPLLFICSPAGSTGVPAYVGNTFGIEGKYQIFEFNGAGNPIRPISGVALAGSAWPSAIKTGNTTHVYASESYGGKWSRLRHFKSVGGAAYTDEGVVFEANASEPDGIGPATVTYDGSTWRVFYLIRDSSGPATTIALATSSDGAAFTRQGAVYTAGSEAPGGLSVSYACTDGSESYLLLHAYASGGATASSILVSATTPDGPYTFEGTMLSPTSATGTVTGGAGNAFASFTGTLTKGRPIVINGADPTVYLVMQIDGSTVYFDRPLEATHTAASFADVFSAKIDMSFIRKVGSGWVGAATGYGQFSGVTSEYSAPVSASLPLGAWHIGSGYFLNPYFNSGKDSTENPEPIRTSSGC